jgi:hypothetical protein
MLVFKGLLTTASLYNMCIIPRELEIDQDTTSLITQLNDTDVKLHIALSEIPQQKNYREKCEEKFGTTSFEFVPFDSPEFVETLAKCQVVMFKQHGIIHHYRLLNRNKTYIRIVHGAAGKSQRARYKQCRIIQFSPFLRNYVETTTSEIARLYLARKCGKNPGMIKKYGIPRFDRAKYLSHNPNDNFVSESARNVLTTPEHTYNILYAPTHKDGEFSTTLFPFPDFKYDELTEFLDDNSIRVLIRMHINEEYSKIADQFINDNTIIYAGHNFAESAIEIFPYVDALITDYSSIYNEFTLFDKPIIFVQDHMDKYEQLRGFAFDYNKFWPGPKIETQNKFTATIHDCVIQKNDPFSYERKLFRDVFFSDDDRLFIQKIIDDLSE